MSYLLFITTHTSKEEGLPVIVTDLSVLVSHRFPFFKKAYVGSRDRFPLLLSLLDLFEVTLEAHIRHGFQPPSSHSEDSLAILSLPSISDDCEVVVVSDFIDAVFLSLSLVPPGNSSIGQTQSLLQTLLPRDDPGKQAQVLAMATREPQQLAKRRVLEAVFVNPNADLVHRLIGTLSPREVCHYLSMYGVPLVNMDIILRVLDESVDDEGLLAVLSDARSIASQVKRQHNRGCVNGHKFLSYLLTRQQRQEQRGVQTKAKSNSVTEGSVAAAGGVVDAEMLAVSPSVQGAGPVLGVEEAVSIVFHSPAEPASAPAARRLVSFLLTLLRDNHHLSDEETQLLSLFIKKLRDHSSSANSLDSILKQSHSWHLFHLVSRVVLKTSPSLTREYLDSCLSVIKAQSSNARARQVLGSCVSLLSPPSFSVPSFSTLARGSSSKVAGSIVQPGHDLEETLLPLARHSVLGESQQNFIEVLLKLRPRVPSVRGLTCDLIEVMDPELVLVSPLMHSTLFSSTDLTFLLEKFLHCVSLSTLQATLVKALDSPPSKLVYYYYYYYY